METLPLQDYNIYVGDFDQRLSDWLAEKVYSRLLIIVDQNTKMHCWPLLEPVVSAYQHSLIEIPAGEDHKHLETCQQIWQTMMEARADRRSLTIDLGGGVIGDMGGFCASTFKRGMDFVQMPTTLLSQVDASIGGKLGIDFMQVKNSIGVFRNPQAVYIDPRFLRTLSARELRSGFAEIIKHSLIADREQWEELRQISDLGKVDWPKLIVPSLRIKQRIVEIDPFERGLRKALNFGHTIGHAVEGHALETDAPLLHGEAIAVGMIAETYLSHRQLDLSAEALETITDFIRRIYEPVALDPATFPELLRLMSNDKKNESQAINFSLLPAAGSVEVNRTASPAEIVESLEYYNEIVAVGNRI
ncbi:3-dehydroquinate synthase [Flavilitoribacter nigricans]|uniref:3-dehydroquinate synthase n=1 Tax=Flavilitoribacter nigricans (strain ATCC 23147 / DSM 23189 / NBRC 102662 / NCIMB 1420 / SS-2) TaxID=1122177 RepID=A0A2D0N8A4_FLAN2|nr:3-dehydroquinate synthase [Flavilitoribacter nigricans]PHN04620.1 3-dehydroquinate synthase [Flavilitoribacter nigricans DSM 23189 = NBRC 102662]